MKTSLEALRKDYIIKACFYEILYTFCENNNAIDQYKTLGKQIVRFVEEVLSKNLHQYKSGDEKSFNLIHFTFKHSCIIILCIKLLYKLLF